MANGPYEGDPEELVRQDAMALNEGNPESAVNVDSGEVTEPDETGAAEALPKELQDCLIALVDKYEQEEEEVREPFLREWKLMEHFWNDNQYNVWSEVAQDWRPIAEYAGEDDLDLEGFSPRTVNIYKAHGESIIAAMSAGIPSTKFFPDDADSQDDVSTSKVYSRAAELIQRRNKAPILLIRTLYILWNQGVCAFYNYARTDPKLGTVVQPVRGNVPLTRDEKYCPQCGMDFDETQPCATCGYQGPAEVDTITEEVPGVVGQEEIPRITEDIKVFSPLYFRIPHRATTQEECGWLTLDTEQSPGAVIAAFKKDIPNIRELVQPTQDEERYDRWARNLSNDRGYGQTQLVTVRQRWLRSWALEEIEEEGHREQLLERFPNGCYFVQAGDNFITARDENLDDHWTISTSPTSPHLFAQALGKSLKTIQELTNELVTMTIDNIEHGTPMSFIDTEMLNIKKFKDSKVVPGAVYPVKVPPGQNIGNYIHETKPATLSEEVRYFAGELKEFAQFASGAFPSIYGGVASGGSNTAKEYEMSRAQALQRLQTTWRNVSECWSDMIAKSVKDYLNNLKYDERFVKKHGSVGFINVWIRKSEMTGKVGEVMADTSETFPINNVQKRDLLMKMLEMQNPNLDAAIFHPENVQNIAQLIGFPDLYIPGEDDRSKQLNEITILLTGQPIPVGMDPMTGEPIMQPSVLPEKDIDDDAIHMQTIKSFLISETGQLLQIENPMGYQNCIAHFKAHEMNQMMTMMKQGMAGAGSEIPGDEGNPSVEAPQGVESGAV